MQKSRRTAFTLIEVLIVVGIIALLISILLPTIATAKEMARRTACAANLRQFADATRSLATDNNGRFLLSNRHLSSVDTYTDSYAKVAAGVQKDSDHIHWLPQHLYLLYKKRFDMDMMTFKCPSMPDEWMRQEPANNPVRARMSYFLLAGRNEPSFPVLTNNKRLTMPMKLTDRADALIAAEIIEQGTQTQTAGTNSYGTQAPHGPTGFVSTSDMTKMPEDIKSSGGNFAFMDGSVQWLTQPTLAPFYSHTANSTPGAQWKKGWFPERSAE